MNKQVQNLSGGCLCQAVRYEVTGRPIWVGHCHCNSCRKQTGAPVVTFGSYRKEKVKFTGTERKFYYSSPGVARGFCDQCGTPLTWEGQSNLPDRGEIIEFYISTLDNPSSLRPTNHVWYSQRISWFEVHDELPRYSEFDFNSDIISTGP